MTRYSRRTAFGDAVGYVALFGGLCTALGPMLLDIASFISQYTTGAETTHLGHIYGPTGFIIATTGVAILYANRKRKSGERLDAETHKLEGRIDSLQEQSKRTEELDKKVAALG
jgi:hypothetical protein